MTKEKSPQGIALIWIVIAGALLIVSVGISISRGKVSQIEEPPPTQEDVYQQEPLLKILPPKERAELESAIREAQQVLQNIEVFDYTPPSIDDITKGLNQINKEAQEQIRTPPPIDPKKIEEYFNQNPPAVPQEGKEFSPEAQEYYYRKYILKDPTFQW